LWRRTLAAFPFRLGTPAAIGRSYNNPNNPVACGRNANNLN